MPSQHSLPRHHSPLPPLKTLGPGAAIGAVAGGALGLLLDSAVATALLALAGGLLVVALVAAVPDRKPRAPAAPRPAHPVATPTATLAVPPPGPDAPPGWYPDPDPEGDPNAGVRRLWDGERWTEHRWAPR
ncbi:hypothetical protein DSM104299_04996 [Baekduia alba]|uniref:DUF2510 domain-containing protein n=1 Tax=Baekduia alba TaxID=2997333 RepID=UPI002341C1D6|nr:DUF2510 domain-containing protein [Baekduia alba]WCB96239.1 hypothetical protein DSM104299_04996 [Baekduia alba]